MNSNTPSSAWTQSNALLFEYDAPGEPRTSYLICSVPRSGSNLLCELLFATGLAGAPTELFHPNFVQVLEERWEVDSVDEYVRLLLARKTGPNGVFGAKANWGQYQDFFGDADPRERFPDLRLIYTCRRDHLRQAVSWVRALQTARWISTHEHPRQEREATYDPEHITRLLGRVAREEQAWNELFDRFGVEPLRVVYEDLVSDHDRTVRRALEFIGVHPPAQLGLEPTLEPLADATSDEWVERYRAENDGP
jgi:LPS sulfotransferase NodH